MALIPERIRYTFRYENYHSLKCNVSYQLYNSNRKTAVTTFSVDIFPYFENLTVTSGSGSSLFYKIENPNKKICIKSDKISDKTFLGFFVFVIHGCYSIISSFCQLFFLLIQSVWAFLNFLGNPKSYIKERKISNKEDPKDISVIIYLNDSQMITAKERFILNVQYEITIQSCSIKQMISPILLTFPCYSKNTFIKIYGHPNYQLNIVDWITFQKNILSEGRLDFGIVRLRKRTITQILHKVQNLEGTLKFISKSIKIRGYTKCFRLLIKTHIKPFIKYHLIGQIPRKNADEIVERIKFPNSVHYSIKKPSNDHRLILVPWLFIKPGRGLWFFIGMLIGIITIALNLWFLRYYVNIFNVSNYIPIAAISSCNLSIMVVIRGWLFNENQDNFPTLSPRDLLLWTNNPFFFVNTLLVRKYNLIYAIIIVIYMFFQGCILSHLAS